MSFHNPSCNLCASSCTENRLLFLTYLTYTHAIPSRNCSVLASMPSPQLVQHCFCKFEFTRPGARAEWLAKVSEDRRRVLRGYITSNLEGVKSLQRIPRNYTKLLTGSLKATFTKCTSLGNVIRWFSVCNVSIQQCEQQSNSTTRSNLCEN